MAVVTRVILPEEDGAAVRHILRAKLHFSAHAVSRLAHGGECIFVNGAPVHTPHVLRAGDVLSVETKDQNAPKALITPGNWSLPVVWEDAHLLIVDKPAGMPPIFCRTHPRWRGPWPGAGERTSFFTP
jgi:23S rRNA-/tRNA-specific pseudouridylate synthase